VTREGTVLYGSVIRSAWTRGLPRPLSAPPRKRTEEDSSYRFASPSVLAFATISKTGPRAADPLNETKGKWKRRLWYAYALWLR
jgi:hypothetical protein